MQYLYSQMECKEWDDCSKLMSNFFMSTFSLVFPQICTQFTRLHPQTRKQFFVTSHLSSMFDPVDHRTAFTETEMVSSTLAKNGVYHYLTATHRKYLVPLFPCPLATQFPLNLLPILVAITMDRNGLKTRKGNTTSNNNKTVIHINQLVLLMILHCVYRQRNNRSIWPFRIPSTRLHGNEKKASLCSPLFGVFFFSFLFFSREQKSFDSDAAELEAVSHLLSTVAGPRSSVTS